MSVNIFFTLVMYKNFIMGYIEKTLGNDEKILSEFKIHLIIYLPYALFFWLGYPAYVWLQLLFTEYALTNKRVVTKTGIISRNSDEMRLTKVETVEVKQSIIGRIFGYGNVIITGTGISNVVYAGVSNPLKVKREIDSQLS